MGGTGTASSLAINELREFASFSPAEQRYIRRSLDVGLGRRDAEKIWGRDGAERASIRAQYDAYRAIADLRAATPDEYAGRGFDVFMAALLQMTAFDLAQDRIACFSAYRFLYERLLGAAARPWLPSAFCAAAALPHVRPQRRKQLLHSISEAAATAQGWSPCEPCFYPEWIEQEAA